MGVSSPRPLNGLPTLAALAAMVLYGPVAEAAGAASPWFDNDDSKVRLIAAAEAVGEADSVSLGLHFRLREGWKIYWRTAGDAGYPPSVEWAGSDNLAGAEFSWPAPQRFSILGFETLGYTDEVVLPIAAALERPGRALRLRGVVDYLACKEICIPHQADLALDLPAGAARPSPFAHLINRFAVSVPGDGASHGLALERAEVHGVGAQTVLRVEAASTIPFAAPDLYVEGPEELAFSPPDVRLEDGGTRAFLAVKVFGAEDLEGPLAGRRLTLTLVDGARSAEWVLTVTAAAAPAETEASELPLILVLALIGGLILNLMPCVLPVLSIKLLGVIGHGGGERRTVRLGFIASAAGILFAFLVLAGALIALKAGGMAIGWGIQYQQPWFIVAMTLVVTLFACNLWGFFEVRLPGWLAGPDWLTGSSPGPGPGNGLGGHFLTGAFATLLATPCSAPFLGTAVGFALARGPGEILAIFAALGIGMALPYLAVAAAPGLATRLPRPGPWMIVLCRILGLALAATALWLLSVLAAEAGRSAAVLVGVLMAAVTFRLYLKARADRPLGAIGRASITALVVLAFLVPSWFSEAPASALTGSGEPVAGLWQPFDQEGIGRLVSDGKVVLVDVTADWCITCQVNKAFVLTKGRVVERLSGDGVVAMQADWTRPNDDITRYLASFGRYGIPFDAVYGPGAPEGIVLPELLTSKAVLEALDKASGS